jgi:putative endonuclease
VRRGYLYILSNHDRTTFYIGVTSNIGRRLQQHLDGTGSLFVEKYKLYDLVYCEEFERIVDAIQREKQLKNWHRDWKLRLIRTMNPDMRDLSDEMRWLR